MPLRSLKALTAKDPKDIVTSSQRALYDSIYTICFNWCSDRDGEEVSDFWKYERVKKGWDCRGVRAGFCGGGHTNLHIWWKDTHTLYGVNFLPVIFFYNYKRCNHGGGQGAKWRVKGPFCILCNFLWIYSDFKIRNFKNPLGWEVQGQWAHVLPFLYSSTHPHPSPQLQTK